MGRKVFTLEQVRAAAESVGLDAGVVERMSAALAGETLPARVLTVVCNEGVHPISEAELPGRVLAATSGNLPDATPEELSATLRDTCARVARVLKHEGPFAEVYLVPSGYGVILQKLAETVFQVTGRHAVTLHYDRRSGVYWPIDLDIRGIVGGA